MRNPAHVREGRLIKAARVRTRRTQKELARMAGIAEATLARYEIGGQPAPRRRLRQFADLLSAPELAEAADERTERAARQAESRPTSTLLPAGRDLFHAREGLFDWWTPRVDQLRRKEGLVPARIDAIRAELSRVASSMLMSAEVSVQQTSDKFLLEVLEALLQIQLKVEHQAAGSRAESAA